MIRLVKATKNYGRQTLYDGVDASIVRGERIGLLGKNGSGKSTLFKVLMGQEHLDSGEMLRDRKVSIGYLPQEIHPLKEGTVFENMLNHLGPWTEADVRLKAVMKGLEDGDPKALDDYDDALEAFLSAGGYEMEARAKAILLGLGFSVRQLEEPVGHPLGRLGPCGLPLAACSPSSMTCSSSTSPRTTSTCSRSSGSRTSCKGTQGPS